MPMYFNGLAAHHLHDREFHEALPARLLRTSLRHASVVSELCEIHTRRSRNHALGSLIDRSLESETRCAESDGTAGRFTMRPFNIAHMSRISNLV